MIYYGENTKRALDAIIDIDLDKISKDDLSQIIRDTYTEKDRLLSSINSEGLEHFAQILTIYCDSQLNTNKKRKKQVQEKYVNGISNSALVMKTHYLNKNIHKRRSFSRDHAICFCYAVGMTETEANVAMRKLFGHHSFHNRDYRDLIFSFFLKKNTAANCVENYSAAIETIEKYMPIYEQLECDYQLDSRVGHENDLTNYFDERLNEFHIIEELTEFLDNEDTQYETGRTYRTLLTAYYICVSKIMREIIIGITDVDEYEYDFDAIKKIYSDNRSNPKAIFEGMLYLLNSSLDPYYRYLKKGALPHCRSAFTVWKNLYNYACEYYDNEIASKDYICDLLSHFKEHERPRIERAIKKSFIINVFTLNYYGGQFSLKKEYNRIVNYNPETSAETIVLDEHREEKAYEQEEWLRQRRKRIYQPIQEELFPKKYADSNINYIDKGCVSEDLAMATDLVRTIKPPINLNKTNKEKRETEIGRWIEHRVYQKPHICKKISSVLDLITLAAEVFNNDDNLSKFDISEADIQPEYLEKLSAKCEKLSNEPIIPSSASCDRDIMMFAFFVSATISAYEKRQEDKLDKNIKIDWCKVITDTNINLYKCGLAQFDPYNPLDYLIILSTNSKSPFMYIQGILDTVRDYQILQLKELKKSEKEHSHM